LWVGRGGGLAGKRFQEDIRSGKWKTQVYEVNTSSVDRPSPNFFHLQEFVDAVSDGSGAEDLSS